MPPTPGGGQDTQFWNCEPAENQHDGVNSEKKKGLTPAQDPQAVDHGGVGVGSHHAVGVNEAVSHLDHSGQMLKIHLMDRTNVWRNHVHIFKSIWAPLFG